jgi:hypothetical protein
MANALRHGTRERHLIEPRPDRALEACNAAGLEREGRPRLRLI